MSDQSPRMPRARKVLTGVSTVAMTAITFAAAGFAVVQGADGIAHRAEAAAPPDAVEALPVRVGPLRLSDGYEAQREFVGRIEPVQESALSFEFGGRVTEILVDEGDRVAQGDILARLDTSLLEAERARLLAVREALEANLSFASLSVERRQALQERGFSATETLDRARFDRDALAAQIAQTDASLKATELRLEKSVLRAPYGGVVGARSIDTGASVSSGVPIVRIMTHEQANIRVGVPLWLDPEALERATIRSGGREVQARLIAIRPDIDPATRTRTAILRAESDDLPFGATARLVVPRAVAQPGAWVELRALREGAPGVWTILVVDAEDAARHLAVEVQEVQGDRVYVSGGFVEGLQVVVEGPQRIVPGQRVRPVAADPARLAEGG